METPAVLHLPPFPNITRAMCPATEAQEVEPYSYSFPEYDFIPKEILMQFMPPQLWGYWSLQWPPPMGFWNYFMGWYWEFSNNLQWFFPYMFFDMRYGNVVHRDADPDYGELTFDSTGVDINIEGTGYSVVWTPEEYIFTCDTKDGFLRKAEQSLVDWDTCWDAIVAETPAVITTGVECQSEFYWWFTEEDPPNQISKVWGVRMRRGYITFDTSSLSGKTITSATLKIYVTIDLTYIDEFETDYILNVYQQAWDTLDADDWGGGTLVGSIDGVDLVTSDYNEIIINTDYINKEGETQLKVAWKSDMAGTQPNDPQTYSPAAGETVVVGGGRGTFSSRGATNKPLLVVTVS